MIIATGQITDGRRRQLADHYRAPQFRDAVTLAIVDMKDSLRITPVEWR